MGPRVQQFETETAKYIGVKYAVATNNGTSAIDTMLKTIGIRRGDEVIIPSLTYKATENMVLYNQAIPVFIDIDDTLNIDPSLIEREITRRTKAIMNIDYGGNPADYITLKKIAEQHNIPLLTDGAQSFGSLFHNHQCLTYGQMSTTSFHQAKILTTVEGGMVFTNNKRQRDVSRVIRNQGQQGRFNHVMLGNNYRMTDITASMGVSQIQRFQHTLQLRLQKATYYKEHLKDAGYPVELPFSRQNYFLFLIYVEDQRKMIRYLTHAGVETRMYQPLYDTPVALEASEHIISLPMYHSLTREKQDYVIRKINGFQKSKH